MRPSLHPLRSSSWNNPIFLLTAERWLLYLGLRTVLCPLFFLLQSPLLLFTCMKDLGSMSRRHFQNKGKILSCIECYIVLLVSKTGQMLLGSVVEHLKSLHRRGIIGSKYCLVFCIPQHCTDFSNLGYSLINIFSLQTDHLWVLLYGPH